ncbi:MAG: alpha/beta hydrolase, partial [Lentihominibacter sp.]
YFGSSFGAYITLNYIYGCRLRGAKAFLRSAAVNMPDLFRNPTVEEKQFLEENGYVVLDYDNGRPLKVTEEFINDLWEHDLFQRFKKFGADIRMIHGSGDETIDYDRAKEFSEKHDIEMITVENGDHRLSIPGAPEKVLSEMLEFLNV